MIKIDTHVHTSGISLCSEVNYKRAADLYRRAGYKGLLLSNHYNAYQLSSYNCDAAKFAVRFTDEYKRMRECAPDLRIMFGAEVALDLPDCHYAEFLLIGMDDDFLTDNPWLHRLSQRELYELCTLSGVLVVQTHPFRSQHGHFPHDPEYMDGVEINCHKNFLREEDKVKEYARAHDLLITCGSDFHYESQAGSAGMNVPDDVYTAKDLAKCLKQGRASVFYR